MARPLGELTVARLGEALAAAGPGPAAGSTAAITVALAAGLATKVAKGAADRETVDALDAVRRRALELADEDVAAYSGFLAARKQPGGLQAAVEGIVQVPLDVLALAERVAQLAALLADHGPDALVGDAATAALLAASAAESAAMLAGANLADAGETADPRADDAEERAGLARALAERLV